MCLINEIPSYVYSRKTVVRHRLQIWVRTVTSVHKRKTLHRVLLMSVFVYRHLKASKLYPFSFTRKTGRFQVSRRVYPFASTTFIHIYIPVNGADPTGRAA
jgi:hypothetical protein